MQLQIPQKTLNCFFFTYKAYILSRIKMAIFFDKVKNRHKKPCKKLKEQSGLENEKLRRQKHKKKQLDRKEKL